jgi:hypothetical protein
VVVASRAPVAAVAFFEHTVQIWNWNSGEQLSEFLTVFEHEGHRLTLNPTGRSCVAASWKKGKRNGVACYDARSGQTVWHRTDLRQVQGLRFSALGDAIWCRVEAGPVQRLDAGTGETLASLRAVQDVVESPYSNHFLQLHRNDFSIEGSKGIRVPRLTFAMLDATFTADALCLSEATGPVRCLDCETGSERWRYQPPAGHHVLRISSQGDESIYGVQWGYEHGGSVTLIRLARDSGECAEICRLNSFPDACGFGAGVIVTSSGDVVSLPNGETLRHLVFPQRDYPELPAPVREPLLHFAARFGTIKTIENLIADGADMNLPDDDGSTPLHIAAMKGRLDVVRILLGAGADPRKQNGSAETPAQVAERAGYNEVAECLKVTQ